MTAAHRSTVEDFMNQLNAVDPQFEWTNTISKDEVDFLDLTIYKNGTSLATRTHTKPGHAVQYLPFSSCHRLAARVGIYKTEVYRHLINCSCSADYNKNVDRLEYALRARGYPALTIVKPPSNSATRDVKLRQLYERGSFPSAVALHSKAQRSTLQSADKKIIVCKCEYSPALRYLNLHGTFSKLVRQLQQLLGHSVLRDHRFIVAHPVTNNAFVETYQQNFVKDLSSSVTTRRLG